jgi:two-component system heavy metal sensor histidine kinase CusS
MSSSSAENDDSPPGRGRFPSPRSLSGWLALTTTATAFVILSLISILLYWGMASHLRNLNHLFLRDELNIIMVMLRSEDYKRELAGELQADHAGEEYVKHYVRLLDAEKRTVSETPGMSESLPGSVFPSLERDSHHSGEITWRAPDGSLFLLATAWVDLGKAGGEWGYLQAALDVTNVEQVLASFRTKLVACLIAGFLLCAVTGLVVARRGVRPLREMTARARAITSASLDERLAGAGWPTELNSLAGALDGMLDRIQDSFARLYNSVANLTHKLRTPITIIRGEAEVALTGEHSAEELREVIASSLEECGRLTHLVDNIIFVAQADAGKLQQVLIKTKARAEMEKVLDFYDPLAEEKGIAISCEGDATLEADPALFRKAFANLLSNALIFTPAGGRVDISTRQMDDGSAEIRVADTGCGIAEAELPKIYDRFYRVYETRYLDPHGSGLGLSLVKAIMELHYGSIEVRSQLAKGTTATLEFPPPTA